MKLLNSKELKIFFTFFIIYSFFVYWIGWGEQSRFLLTRAIVDEGRLEIDSFYNQTSDRVYYNNHYYSDKDPGLSFLSVPTYSIWKSIYYNFFSKSFQLKYEGTNEYLLTEVGENKVPIIDYVNPGFFVLISMILIIIFTSSLFSALLLILIYKISKYFTKNDNYRIYLVFIAGLGTLIFPYALIFMEHALATFFGFLSFYLLFKIKQEKIEDKKYFILAGLSSGFAITCSAIMFIVAITCFLYLLSFKKEKLFYFIIGGFIGILPFLLYNYFIFGTPFTLSRHHMDQAIWSKLGGIYGLQMPNIFIFLRLTFDSYRGIFFYYPILLLSFIGLFYMYKKFKKESIIIFLIFFAFLLMNSSWWAWWGGRSFGPRHLTPLSPFLIIPLIYVFKIAENKKLLRYFIIILAFYSIAVNFIGLQFIEDNLIGKDQVFIALQYSEKVYSFSTLSTPLYEHYFPLFLKFGPRSRILENLINKFIDIDIRIFPFSKGINFPELDFYIPFSSLLILSLILIFIWPKETFRFLKKYKLIVLPILALILILYYYNFIFLPTLSSIIFEKGWYIDKDINWMTNNGTMLIRNINAIDSLITFEIKSSDFERDVEVLLDNRKIEFSNISTLNEIVTIPLKSDEHEIRLKFLTKECTRTYPDIRCKSIGISNITLKPVKEGIYFGNGWYHEKEEFYWMKKHGTIIIYFDETGNKTKKEINFDLIAHSNEIPLEIYINDKKLDSIFSLKLKKSVSIPLELKSGFNLIDIISKDCDVQLPDVRCISSGFKNFSISDLSENQIIFAYNWYPKFVSENYTWMTNNGTIFYYNTHSSQNKTLNVTLYGYHIPREMFLELNNKKIYEVKLKSSEDSNFLLNIELEAGLNIIKFISKEDCLFVKEVENVQDIRCLNLGIINLEIK